MSSDAPAAVQAKPGCPDKHRAIVERAMAAIPLAWRLASRTGEVFDSLQLFEDRVRAWLFCDGFEVIRGGGGSKKSGWFERHHSTPSTIMTVDLAGTNSRHC